MKSNFLLVLTALMLPLVATAQLVLTNTFSIPYRSYAWRNDLTNIIIPDGVTNVENFAFMSCTNLTNVVVGKGVTTIGFAAFATMADQSEVIWPRTNAVTIVFTGNAPTNVAYGAFDAVLEYGVLFNAGPCNVTVYYYAESSGWSAMLDDRPAICLDPQLIAYPASVNYFPIHVAPMQTNMVVEASTNLVDWTPVADATVFYHGSDVFAMTGYPVRFFRISQPIPPYIPAYR